jgi:hypothetical protein
VQPGTCLLEVLSGFYRYDVPFAIRPPLFGPTITSVSDLVSHKAGRQFLSITGMDLRTTGVFKFKNAAGGPLNVGIIQVMPAPFGVTLIVSVPRPLNSGQFTVEYDGPDGSARGTGLIV